MTVVLSNDSHFIDDHFTLLVNNNIFLKKNWGDDSIHASKDKRYATVVISKPSAESTLALLHFFAVILTVF